MNRLSLRVLLVAGVVFAVLAGRAAGCRKSAGARSSHPGKTPAHWITPLMTQPPPRPTVTMWKGATRVPQLPE